MPSLFGGAFGRFSQVFRRTHTDETRVVNYSDDNGVEIEIPDAIVRVLDTKEVFGDDGRLKVSARQLVIYKGHFLANGIQRPDTYSSWEFDGDTWEQMTEETEGVNVESDTFVTVNVRRVSRQTLGSNQRKDPTR